MPNHHGRSGGGGPPKSGATSSRPVDAALSYAARGWLVFPVFEPLGPGRCSCGSASCSSVAKHPRVHNGLHDASRDRRTVTRWWSGRPKANVAIATGPSGGLVVLDFDARHGGLETLQQIQIDHGPLPKTLLVATGGGGLHYFFGYPADEDVASGAAVLGPGADIRARGGYIVAPPSVHSSGKHYEWINAPCDVQLAALPPSILTLLRERKKKRAPPPRLVTRSTDRSHDHESRVRRCRAYVDRIPGAPEGARNETFFRAVAPACHGFDLDEDEFLPIARSWNNRCSPTGIDDNELTLTLRNFNETNTYPRGWMLGLRGGTGAGGSSR